MLRPAARRTEGPSDDRAAGRRLAAARRPGDRVLRRADDAPAGLPHSEEEKRRLIEAAKVEAESLKRQAALDAKELAQKARADVEAELKARQAELEKQARETGERERELERQERELKQRLDETARSEKQLAGREAAAEAAARAAAAQAVEARARLEKIAGLSMAEAKARLYDEVRDEARRAAADEVRKIEESARAEAERSRGW